MIVWILFLLLVFIILALDLGVFNKTPHIISTKEASKWTAIWVSLSFAFSGVIYWLYGTNFIANPNKLTQTGAALKFITPEKAKESETQIAVHLLASFVLIICGVLLKTPKSSAKMIKTNNKNNIQTVIRVIFSNIRIRDL